MTTPSEPTRWAANLDALNAGTFGDPCDPETLLRYWKAQEAAGYPYASENVRYFEKMTSKEKQLQEAAEAINAGRLDDHQQIRRTLQEIPQQASEASGPARQEAEDPQEKHAPHRARTAKGGKEKE